jgi:hypothetical protein
LKFRPFEDLVNTLLHEMIHAFLFVTRRVAGRDGHGDAFTTLMDEINSKAGTSITVYHNFTDEVDFYRVHVWRCTGQCRFQAPYFGIVKRSMNRPPQKADSWFSSHQLRCGGEFVKISGPNGLDANGKDIKNADTDAKSSKKKRKGKEIEQDTKNQRKILDFLVGKDVMNECVETVTQKEDILPIDKDKKFKTIEIIDLTDDCLTTGESSLVRHVIPDSVECPICMHSVLSSEINMHLDECINL